MTEHEEPNVDEIKERLQIEVEDVAETGVAETGAAEPAATPEPTDVVDELRNLGRQVGETIRTAWQSEERQNFESDMRQGIQSFADEIDKVIREVREGEAGRKVREEASELRAKVEESDIPAKARGGLIQGLRWLSDELGKLADQFGPKEKEPQPGTVVDEPAGPSDAE